VSPRARRLRRSRAATPLRGPSRVRRLGASLLAAAFLAEAAVSCGWRLHYTSTAIPFAALGVALTIVLGLRGRAHRQITIGPLATLPAGLVAEALLGLVSRQAF
jgi:hypothetical protein